MAQALAPIRYANRNQIYGAGVADNVIRFLKPVIMRQIGNFKQGAIRFP